MCDIIANEYFSCTMLAFAHSSCRSSYAHAFSPHDEDERDDDHRSLVHLIASRFSVTRRISISRATFAQLSTYIPSHRWFSQISSNSVAVAIRKLQAHFEQAGHANEVELAYASPPCRRPRHHHLSSKSIHALMSRHTHAYWILAGSSSISC